ncbi:MAG: low affinity iron permease family protein [Candidatus Microsaccharimonas sp.]
MTTDKITSSKKTHVKIVRHIEPLESDIPTKSHDSFHKISQSVSTKLGSPTAFALAVLLIVAWIVTGPFFHFSDTWQLVINTTTTIVTFLMVFAIQNTQNRDAKAMQLKLDELIKSSRGARTEFVDIEDLTDTELDLLHGEFRVIHEKFRDRRDNK